MTVLLEAAADFFTERIRVSGEGHGTEYVLQALDGMKTWCCTALEDVVALLAGDDDGLTAILGFAHLTEVSLELCNGGLHVNRMI